MPTTNKELLAAANKRYRVRHAAKIAKAKRDRRSSVLKYIQEYKESKGCMDCFMMYPAWVLDFDHRPGTDKVANVSAMLGGYPLIKVIEEIEKCDVVCANCHRDRTHDRLMKSGE